MKLKPAWGYWWIKTTWYAIGHSSKAHLFFVKNKTACGLWVNPGFGSQVVFSDNEKNKCKRCLQIFNKIDKISREQGPAKGEK